MLTMAIPDIDISAVPQYDINVFVTDVYDARDGELEV